MTNTTNETVRALAATSRAKGSTRGTLLLGVTAAIFVGTLLVWWAAERSEPEPARAPARDAVRSGGDPDARNFPAAGTDALDPREEEKGTGTEAGSPAVASELPVAPSPFVAGSPRFGGIPEAAARAIVESVQKHHELAELLRAYPKAPAETVRCVEFLFAVWPEIDALVARGLVEVTATPLEPRHAGTQLGVTYTTLREDKSLAASIWHPQWSCSLRFRGGGSQQEAFERVLRDAEAAGSEAGR